MIKQPRSVRRRQGNTALLLRTSSAKPVHRQHLPRQQGDITYVHNAYQNPQKQNMAISMRKINFIIIARNDKTIRLFLNVTNANLSRCRHEPTSLLRLRTREIH